MSRLSRYFLTGSLAGLVGLTMPSHAADTVQPQSKARYATIEEVPVIRDSTFKARTSEGFSVVIVYANNPHSPNRESRDRGINSILRVSNELDPERAKIFRYDTLNLGLDDTGITDHLREKYQLETRPSVIVFCDGVEVYKRDGIKIDEPGDLPRADPFFRTKIHTAYEECM
jgi:hypothetical protein